MTPERYQQVKELFHEALARTADERQAWLDKRCREAAALGEEVGEEVRRLLAAHEASASFIEEPALALVTDGFVGKAAADDGLPAQRQIGQYRLLREIGQGGMGTVYLAERADRQFHSRVAIKLLRRGLDSQDILRRFLNERQILARLNHPNIARLLDGGSTSDGAPYFIMEYVEGVPVTTYCDQQKLSIAERLRLFRDICAAVQYAHQNLVIHRDLKPGNILVTGEGIVKLLDFGIAKVLSAEAVDFAAGDATAEAAGEGMTQAGAATRTVARLMTPEYASPEQVRGEAITTASDIYSLGVLLYQLLTGARPYRLRSHAPEELARVICAVEPSKPSEAATQSRNAAPTRADGKTAAPTAPGAPGARIAPRRAAPSQLRGDLDNIVLMAMRKEPARRYLSVEQFSEDLRRHLDGLPVIARRDTFGYRAAKFARRNRLAVAAALLLLCSLFAGILTTTWQAKRAEEAAARAQQERDKAELAQAKAERINQFLQRLLSYANPAWYAAGNAKPRDLTVVEALDEAVRQLESELGEQPEIKAEVYKTLGDTFSNIDRLPQAKQCYEASLGLRLQLFGEAHYRTAESRYHLGAVTVLLGDFQNGEALYRQALDFLRTQAKGEDEKRFLPYLLLDLGSLLMRKGELDAAEAPFREAHEFIRERNGEDDFTTGVTHEYLATLYWARGEVAEAERQWLRALPLLEKLRDHNYLMALGRLAHLKMWQRDFQEAERLINLMLENSRQLGNQNAERSALVCFAFLAYKKGDYAKAITYSRQAGAQAPASEWQREFAAAPLSQIGAALMKSGKPAAGERFLREALQIRERLANSDWEVISFRVLLGECLLLQRRFAEAESYLLPSYRRYQANQVAESPRLQETRQLLFQLYQSWNQPQQAAIYAPVAASPP